MSATGPLHLPQPTYPASSSLSGSEKYGKVQDSKEGRCQYQAQKVRQMGSDIEALEVLRNLEVVRQIAERQGRLTGREVRVLRQRMERSGRKLAEEIGCDMDDIARCE